MKFKATEEQIKIMAANATNAAVPVGLGFLHYEAGKTYIPKFFVVNKWGLDYDYVQGRMVKLTIKRISENEWEPTAICRTPTMDYQSWVTKYPTFEALCESAGIKTKLEESK